MPYANIWLSERIMVCDWSVAMFKMFLLASRCGRPFPPLSNAKNRVIFSLNIGRIYICDMILKEKYHISPLLYINGFHNAQ